MHLIRLASAAVHGVQRRDNLALCVALALAVLVPPLRFGQRKEVGRSTLFLFIFCCPRNRRPLVIFVFLFFKARWLYRPTGMCAVTSRHRCLALLSHSPSSSSRLGSPFVDGRREGDSLTFPPLASFRHSFHLISLHPFEERKKSRGIKRDGRKRR